MKKIVVAIIVVVALIGAGVAGVPLAEAYVARNIKAEIDSAGALTVGSVEVGLFDRRVTMRDVHSRVVDGFSVANWEASGLSWPLGELLRGQSPFGGLRLGDPFHAGRLKFDDLRIVLPDGQSWNFASVALEGIDLARFDPAVTAGPFRTGALGARFLSALSVHRLKEHDITYAASSATGKVRIADLTIDDFDRGKLAALSITGLSVAGAVVPTFTLADVKAKSVDLRRPLAALSDPAWRPSMPVGRIDVGEAMASGFGGDLLTQNGVSLGSVSMQVVHEGDVSRSHSLVEGFVVQPPPGIQGLQMRALMTAMDLKELRLRLECAGFEDRTKGELGVDRCALVDPDLGEIDLAARLVNGDAKLWQAFDSGDLRQIYGTHVALGSASLTVVDKSLLERSLRALSKTNGQTPAVTRANVAGEIRRFQPAGVLITDDMTKLLDTVASFIEKGGTLTVEARPDPPLELANAAILQRPGPDVVSLLGLSSKLAK